MIQQRAVAVRRLRQAIQEAAEQLDVPRVDLDEGRELLGLVAVVRRVVPRLVDPEIREHQLARLAVHHEREDAREVGLIRHRHQLEHDADVLFERRRYPDRCVRHDELFGRLFLGALNPLFDLAHVVEILVQPRAIARPEPALERRHVVAHRVENALVGLHAGHAIRRGARTAEHPLEHDARIDFHRQRCCRALPRDRAHVGAAVAHVARADVSRLVLGGDFERREHRVLADQARGHLVERDAGVEVLGLGTLGRRSGEPRRGADRVGAARRTIQVRDDDEAVAEFLDRLQDRRELEPGPRGRRRPVTGPLAHRHEHGAKPERWLRGGLRQRRRGGNHRIEEREGQRGTHPLEDRPARQRPLGDEHVRSLMPIVTNLSALRGGNQRRVRRRAHLERHAANDTQDQRRESVVLGARVTDGGADHRHVGRRQAAADRIGQQLLGHRAHERLRVAHEGVPERDDAVKPGAVGQLSRRVDRIAERPAVLHAPRANRVEVLEREPDGIHDAVTRRTRRAGAMLFERLSSGARLLGLLFVVQRRHVVGRRRRRHADDVLEHPLAAQHRRRAMRVRGGQQDGALAQQAAPRVVGQRDAAELAAVDPWHVVVPREPLVDEAVVRGHQIEDIAVLVDDAAEEQLDLADHRATQVVVEVGELERIGLLVAQVAEVQPLAGEILDERMRLRVREHAPHLPIQHRRLLQLAFRRRVEQVVVRDAAPEEERQPGRQREVRQPIGGAGSDARRIGLDAQQELRARENAAQRHVDAAVEVAGLFASPREEVDQDL